MTETIASFIDKQKIQKGTEAIKQSLNWWGRKWISRNRFTEKVVVWYYEQKLFRVIKKSIK
jgi:hypothetical protein